MIDCTHQGTTLRPRSNSAVNQALRLTQQICEQRRLRLTPLRRDVYQELFRSGRALSAYDLLERMQALMNKRMAPLTIYRALDFLLEQGLIHRLESSNAYVACDHPGGMHQAIYFVCSCCGRTEEVESDSVLKALNKEAEQHHFRPLRPVIEIIGLCRHCTADA